MPLESIAKAFYKESLTKMKFACVQLMCSFLILIDVVIECQSTTNKYVNKYVNQFH